MHIIKFIISLNSNFQYAESFIWRWSQSTYCTIGWCCNPRRSIHSQITKLLQQPCTFSTEEHKKYQECFSGESARVWCYKMYSDQLVSVLVTLELQLTILKLVKSLSEADFEMYAVALTQFMPWVFTIDQATLTIPTAGCPSSSMTCVPCVIHKSKHSLC